MMDNQQLLQFRQRAVRLLLQPRPQSPMQLRCELAARPRPVSHPLCLPIALALGDHLAPPAIADTEVVRDLPHDLPATIMGHQKFTP